MLYPKHYAISACKKGTSGKLYAMKIMNKKRIKIKKSEQLTLNEQICLADVKSPFVVELAYSFHSQDDVFLILDLMTGGDLSFHLCQKGLFSKKECLYYGARIMLGLQALHDKGYVYRDLKPENCLLSEDGRVKLTDLGLAVKVTPHLHGAAGTRGYWAPEMLRRDKNGKRMSYNHIVDWFSFGCMLAEFISGINPFRSEKALEFGLAKKPLMAEASDASESKKDKKDDRKRQKVRHEVCVYGCCFGFQESLSAHYVFVLTSLFVRKKPLTVPHWKCIQNSIPTSSQRKRPIFADVSSTRIQQQGSEQMDAEKSCHTHILPKSIGRKSSPTESDHPSSHHEM
jgi:serine/threonine protein kinase